MFCPPTLIRPPSQQPGRPILSLEFTCSESNSGMRQHRRHPHSTAAPPLPPSLGALHGHLWIHQSTCTNPVHAACPQLSLGPTSGRRCTQWGVFLFERVGPGKKSTQSYGPWTGIQGFQGSRVWLASAEFRLQAGRFFLTLWSPHPTEGRRTDGVANEIHSQAQSKALLAQVWGWNWIQIPQLINEKTEAKVTWLLSGCTGMSWFPAFFVRLPP